MKQFVGIEPLTMVRIGRDETATMAYVYEGAPVPEGADPADLERLVEEGYLEEREVADPETDDGPPAKSAKKEVWEEYARSQGATDEELDGTSKDDLIAAYGA